MRRRAAGIAIGLVIVACAAEPSAPADRSASAAASPSPSAAMSRLGAFPPVPDDPLPAEITAALQAVLDTEVDPLHAPAIAAAVIDGRRGTWTGAAGTSDGEVPLDVAAQFGIGSVTKTVIAAQVLRLVEEGRVELDERMDAYLDAEEVPTNGATVRQILGMRSGIPDPEVDVVEWCRDLAAPFDWADALTQLSDESLFEPGLRFRYTNVNYVIAGLLIEEVTGRSVPDVLRAGVLNDPELRRLVYQDAESPTSPLAAPFVTVPGASALPGPSEFLAAGEGYLPARCLASAAGPAGGMASDARTLATWGHQLYGGGVLSQASLDAMTDFVDGYGLGAQDYRPAFGHPAVGHGGLVPGYVAQLVAFPDEGVIIAVLINTNRETRDIGTIASHLRAALTSGSGGS